jgi:hypothetical protein
MVGGGRKNEEEKAKRHDDGAMKAHEQLIERD